MSTKSTRSTNQIAFLDRDGVLNLDNGYIGHPSEWQSTGGANDEGFRVIVVTNQPGIASGYYTESQFHDLTAWVQQQLAEQHACIDGYYYFPHHPKQGRAPCVHKCNCRKTEPAISPEGLRQFNSFPSNCFMIGDSKKDLEAANRVGILAFSFTPGENLRRYIFALRVGFRNRPVSASMENYN